MSPTKKLLHKLSWRRMLLIGRIAFSAVLVVYSVAMFASGLRYAELKDTDTPYMIYCMLLLGAMYLYFMWQYMKHEAEITLFYMDYAEFLEYKLAKVISEKIDKEEKEREKKSDS